MKNKISIKHIAFFLVFFIILLMLIQCYFLYFDKSKTYGKEESESSNITISNAEVVNLDNIIEKNVGGNRRQEIEKQEVELEYLTKYKVNSKLPKGMVQVVQEGRSGKQEIVVQKTYENNEVVAEEQLSCKVTKASMNKIVEVGGSNYTSKHVVKVGDIVYVTASRLSVMLEPNDNSQKVASLNKDTELKVKSIQNEWYNISSNGTYGWVKSEGTSYINPNEEFTPENSTSVTNGKGGKTKEQAVSNLSFDMKLNQPSGLSLDQFKKILTDSRDTKGVISSNAEYFYYIESQYNINGVFVASMAIHESSWGTSNIANSKKNLFGYGAYDSNPYNGAYNFSNYSESIDLLGRVFVKYYLNPHGTQIYGGETASGKYYSSSTLTGVNNKYASDKEWANKVYEIMQSLYNKL